MTRISDFIRFNIPDYLTRTKHTEPLLSEVDRVLDELDGEEITEGARDYAAELINSLPRGLPMRNEYKRLLKKYGYLPRIIDPTTYAIEKFRNNFVTTDLIAEFKRDITRSEAYNIFSVVANYPPTNLAKPFEQLLMDAIIHNGGNASKPVDLDDTPAMRYDLYLPDHNTRVEVKTTRLIDASKRGDMGRRFLPYGLGSKFATGIKQVKLMYFDVLVMNIVASNVSLYAVYTRDDVERIILENFVEKSDKHFSAGLIHNTDRTPKTPTEREKRVWTDEFIFTFPSYRGMSDILSYARAVTFDINECARAVMESVS